MCVCIVFACFLYFVFVIVCVCVCMYVRMGEHLVQARLLCDPCPLTKIDNNSNNKLIYSNI